MLALKSSMVGFAPIFYLCGRDAMDLEGRLEATLQAMGYELVLLDLAPRGLLRLFIDQPRGITIDNCVAVSNHLTRWLEVEQIQYERLEVSSPGLDRPLTKPEHYQRFAGRAVKIKTRDLVDRRKNFVGVLSGIHGDQVLLQAEGVEISLPLALIERARLVPQLPEKKPSR